MRSLPCLAFFTEHVPTPTHVVACVGACFFLRPDHVPLHGPLFCVPSHPLTDPGLCPPWAAVNMPL